MSEAAKNNKNINDDEVKNNGIRLDQKFACVANELDHKEPCKSSDALCVYLKTDGEDEEEFYDGFCWSCRQYFSKSDLKSTSLNGYLYGDSSSGNIQQTKKHFTKKQEPLTREQLAEFKKVIGFTDKPYRKLKPEWLKFFGHMVKTNNNGIPVEVWYPESEESSVTGFKIRILPKSFTKVGKTGSECDLSGLLCYKSANKRLLIVGGENDKVAAYGCLKMYYDEKKTPEFMPHVVAGTVGEQGLVKQLRRIYDKIDKYEEIYIGLDNDEAGIKATEACAKILPANKVKIVTWSGKDPHKLLEEGKEKQVVRDFFNAKDYVPSGIKSAADAMSEVEEFLTAPKITLPPYLHKIEKKLRGGIRSTGAIVNIIGDTSIGKSFFSDNLEQHWFFNSPIVPTIISLERTAGELLTDHYSLYLKKNLTWFTDGHDAMAYINQPEVKSLVENLVYNEDNRARFHIIDERDGTIEVLKKQVDRAWKQYDSKMFIFDPLTDWLRSLPQGEAENFFMWQKLMKKEGLVFINVLHTRKPPPDKDGKVRDVNEYDVLGTGSSVQSADINIVLNRNKMAATEVERNTTHISLPKARGGETGPVGKYYYDPVTRQQYDFDDFFNGNVKPSVESSKESKNILVDQQSSDDLGVSSSIMEEIDF